MYCLLHVILLKLGERIGKIDKQESGMEELLEKKEEPDKKKD